MKLFTVKNFYEKQLGNLLIGILLFHIISSFLDKIIDYFCFEYYIQPLTAFFKFVLLFFLIGILIINYKEKRTLFLYLGIFSFIFILGNLKGILAINTVYDLYISLKEGNIYYFNKYLYPFVFLGVFLLIKNKEETLSRYFGILESILFINAFFVFLGFLFSINYLQSYLHSTRFGYSGVLERVFFIYFSVIVISRRVFLDKMNVRLALLCLAILLTGTKVVILFFILLFFYYLYNKNYKKLFLIAFGLLMLGIILIKPIVSLVTELFPFWQPVLGKYGYLGVLFSNRDMFFQNTLEYIVNHGTLNNLLFGGLEYSKYWIQMDLIDLFLFFGIVGGLVYLLVLSKLINKNYHLIPLLTSFLVGGFLFSTIIISTYFLWMYESKKEEKILF